MKKLLAVVPVNLGQWRNYPAGTGVDRGDGWTECYFQEAVFNWGWLPKNCYGKFGIEMKEANQKMEPFDVEVGWVKSVRDGGAGKFNRLEGSKLSIGNYEVPHQRRWEIYESDYFKLPEENGTILLYLIRRGNPPAVLAIAMWTLAIFEEIPDAKAD